MDDCEKRNQEMERCQIFDISFDDDCLIASPSGRTVEFGSSEKQENDGFGLFEVWNAQNWEDAADLSRQKKQTPVSSESFESERSREVNKCNIRKSIAWDSAFFTSAGVLNPEELSIINKGFSKAALPLLPRIQEDVRRSTLSDSTLDSDSLTLESIEIDLFEDLRASIQKFSKCSNVTSSSINPGTVERGPPSLSSSKRFGLPSPEKMKSIAASKRQTVGIQSSANTAKKASVRQHVVQPSDLIKPASKSGTPNSSSSKPPKMLSRAVPISAAPAKRSSLCTGRIQAERNTTKAASGKRTPDVRPKRHKSGDCGSVTPRSSPSTRSSFSGSPVSTVSRCGSISSDSRGESPSNFWSNKTSTRNINPVPFGSTPMKPKRISSRSKADSGNSRFSAHIMSPSKQHSSVSSASPIGRWSSESSSAPNQRSSNSKTSKFLHGRFHLDIETSQALDAQTHCQRSSKNVGVGAELMSECEMELPVDTNALSHLASSNVSRSIKPSGLRMPSPKIGFFDAEKTALPTPKRVLGAARNGLPKDGPGTSCLNVSATKVKPGKVQPPRVLTKTGKMISESEHGRVLRPSASIKPNSADLHEQANASPKVLTDALNCGTGLNAKVKGGIDPSKKNIVPNNGSQVSLRAAKISPSEEVGTCNPGDKENFFGIEDQVGSLITSVRLIDLNPGVLN